MFPDLTVIWWVTAFAAGLAAAFPFVGLRGFVRNFLIGVVVVCAFLWAGVMLGLIFHSALFGEPLVTDERMSDGGAAGS